MRSRAMMEALVREASAAGLQAAEGQRYEEILGGLTALIAMPPLTVPEGTWRVDEVLAATPEPETATVTVRWTATTTDGNRMSGVHGAEGPRTPIGLVGTVLEAFVGAARAARAKLRGDGPLKLLVMPRRLDDHELSDAALERTAADLQERGVLAVDTHRVKILSVGVEAAGVFVEVDPTPELRKVITAAFKASTSHGFSMGSKS